MSALNITRMPSASDVPSILYPVAFSTVLNASVVLKSIRSISFLALVPKLNNFSPALNSIIGLAALEL